MTILTRISNNQVKTGSIHASKITPATITGELFANSLSFPDTVYANNIIFPDNSQQSSAWTGNLQNLFVDTLTVQQTFSANSFNVSGSTGNAGEILTADGTGQSYWSKKYTVGSLPPDAPNYGDTWYYTDLEKLYIWINDGASDYWYDFLPPTG